MKSFGKVNQYKMSAYIKGEGLDFELIGLIIHKKDKSLNRKVSGMDSLESILN